MRTAYCFSHFQTDPAFNMAFDDAMAHATQQRHDSVLIRVYTWTPGGITIGLNQPRELALDWERIGSTPVVRRITGGRALYHDPSELTYAIGVGLDSGHEFGPGQSRQLAARISEGIVSFLDGLGIHAELLRTNDRFAPASVRATKAPCFGSMARYEIVAGESKLVASAARSTRRGFFQHGSIKMNGLVSHPALPLRDQIAQRPDAPAITEAQFATYAERFFASLSRTLGCDPVPETSPKTVPAGFLSERIALVGKGPLEVRRLD